MMFLFINTMPQGKLTVALYTKDGFVIHEREVPVSYNESEQLLKAIDAMRGVQSVEGIIVMSEGEGRFSALRTGIACANALGFAWDVPVRGVHSIDKIKEVILEMAGSEFTRFDGTVVPRYAREPNIT